jgi:ABC-2 type transport system permease protein
MRGLRTLSRTELALFLREPVTVIFTLALPLMVLYILNGVFAGDGVGGGGGGGEDDFIVYRGFDAADWYTPAYVALAVAGFALIALPAHMVEYRETGVLRRFQASGVQRGVVLTSQTIVALVISTVGAGLLLAAAVLFTGASSPANVGLFAVAYAFGAVAVTPFGIMLGAVLPTTRAAQAVGLLLWFVFLVLSGSGPPPEVLPDGLRTIGEWLPLTPIVQVMQEPWLTGEWLTQEATRAAGIGLVSAGVAWVAYRWE